MWGYLYMYVQPMDNWLAIHTLYVHRTLYITHTHTHTHTLIRVNTHACTHALAHMDVINVFKITFLKVCVNVYARGSVSERVHMRVRMSMCVCVRALSLMCGCECKMPSNRQLSDLCVICRRINGDDLELPNIQQGMVRPSSPGGPSNGGHMSRPRSRTNRPPMTARSYTDLGPQVGRSHCLRVCLSTFCN